MTTPTLDPPPAPRGTADPRNTITPDAFRLAPELLGTPLARPWRRAVAMAIDGLCIAILSNAPGVLFAFAGAWLLFRISGKPVAGSYLRRSRRLTFRFGGAVVLFVAVLIAWDEVTDRMEEGDEESQAALSSDDDARNPSGEPGTGVVTGVQGLRTAADLARFTQAENEAEARRIAGDVARSLRASGVDEEEVREIFTGLSTRPDKPWLAAAADSVLAGLDPPVAATSISPDSLLDAYAAARAAADSARAAELEARAGLLLAADTLGKLGDALQDERRERVQAERALEAERERNEAGAGVMGTIRALADDLGLGLGWAGLYFTAFLTLWRGATPGKRLLGIRVIRLDGQPIGWWAAFERFGGYAAGLATGLLGFAQIFWDRNRQAVQDKISETVVIDSPGR